MAASAAQFQARSGANRAQDMIERFDRLMLVVQAMWSIMEEDGHTHEELVARMEQIDAADGTEDGRKTPTPQTCPGCQAKVGHGLTHCQFCGTEMAEHDPFAV